MNGNDSVFKILIVDDSRELREILEEYLGSEGDTVEGANNGKEALEKYRNNYYDLIITDLNMPELAGMELIKAIRQENEITEFVIITGYASIDSAVEAIKNGAFDYIVKPFRMEELKVVVKNVREKVRLKKLNAQLYDTLKSFNEEIERYHQKNEEGIVNKEPKEVIFESISNAEKIVEKIKKFEKLKKNRHSN
ncbi:MAG: response regulator receiver protein [Deltaproteobacteria bacterium]|nr:response regulator receiver protein [Deltaproteobacteria bacterium]